MSAERETPVRDEAPPVFQPPPGNARFPLFDGVRGVAAIGVVIVHSAMLVNANIGTVYGDYVMRLDIVLTLFFVTSGFLLYRPYIAGRLGVGRAPKLSAYARNRFLRIVPAYWVAMTVLALFLGLPGFWGGHTWVYYFFLQEFDRGWAFGGILPAWSLCVEMTFYILLPLVAWIMVRRSRGRTRRQILRNECILIGLFLLIGLVYRIAVERHIGYDPGSNLWALLPAGIDWIAAGMALAVASAAVATSARRPRFVTFVERHAIVLWLAVVAGFLFASKANGFRGNWGDSVTTFQWVLQHELYLLMAVAFVLPAVFGDHRSGVPRKVLGNRVIVWFGTVSYGIFLYHDPLLYYLDKWRVSELWSGARMIGLTVATLIASAACAAASYYLIERPLLRYKKTRTTDPGHDAPAPAPVPVGQPARSAG